MRFTVSPKQRYLNPPGVRPNQRTNAAKWNDLTADPLFLEAVEVALAEYTVRVAGKPTALQESASNTLRLEGALAVLNILGNLGDPDIANRRPIPADQLDPVR